MGTARAHDVGGSVEGVPIDRTQHVQEDWEMLAEAIRAALGELKLLTMHEVRRAAEDLGPETYHTLGYYQRRITALQKVLVEKGLLTDDEVAERIEQLRQAAHADH